MTWTALAILVMFLVSSCTHFPFFVVTPEDIIEFSKTRKKEQSAVKMLLQKNDYKSNPTKPLNAPNFSV